MSFSTKIRKLDIFKKVPHELNEGTNTGGIISIITVLSIAYFLTIQIKNYISPTYNATITTGRLVTRRQMMINLDITFPRFPCEIISLDIQDEMMSHSLNLGSIKKYRLDRNGQKIDDDDFQLLREPSPLRQVQMAEDAFKNQRGCRLMGGFTVKEVPGNFHISSHAYQNQFATLRAKGVAQTLDVTHTINSLYFGDLNNIKSVVKNHPEASLISLQNTTKNHPTGQTHSYTSHYHIDIVPTYYHDNFFGETQAYQYTSNHNTFQVHHMPSLYFNYHMEGIAVSINGDNDSLSVFLIKLCAIIGGTYTLTSFLDNALDNLMDQRKKQYQLIK